MTGYRLTALCAVFLVGACGGAEPDAQVQPAQAAADTAAVVPQAVQDQVARIGEDAAQALRAGLSVRLTAALAEGGPEAAIDVCALEALPLTDSIAAAAPAGTELKRTALRIRNPRNAADSLEAMALQWFADHDGERPPYLVQADGGHYRYYAPLRVAAMCTTCHGPADSLPAGVREALQRRYPDDRATGYREGDLRGLIRVSVPAAAVTQ